jgi:hypothetical protein
LESINIRRPKPTDSEELHSFFLLVITDTFAKEGLAGLHDDQKDEWEIKKLYLQWDLESQGEKRFFWIAFRD